MDDLIIQKMLDQGVNELVGGGNPASIGSENFNLLRSLANLQPDMSVLDFGCGCGRLALPVLRFLSSEGKYTGVDIVPKLVEFCQEEIAPLYDNAAFSLSMDGNKLYDKFYSAPQKQLTTISSLAELGTNKFDLIVAFSVFTHLSLDEANDYFKQLYSLLKPGGNLVISTFLINESSRSYFNANLSHIEFDADILEDKSVYYKDIDGQLYAVGFQEKHLIAVGKVAGLDPAVIYYGHWCGRGRSDSFQDVVVFTDSPQLPEEFDPINYMKLNPDLPWTHDEDGAKQATTHYLNHGYYEMRDWR